MKLNGKLINMTDPMDRAALRREARRQFNEKYPPPKLGIAIEQLQVTIDNEFLNTYRRIIAWHVKTRLRK